MRLLYWTLPFIVMTTNCRSNCSNRSSSETCFSSVIKRSFEYKIGATKFSFRIWRWRGWLPKGLPRGWMPGDCRWECPQYFIDNFHMLEWMNVQSHPWQRIHFVVHFVHANPWLFTTSMTKPFLDFVHLLLKCRSRTQATHLSPKYLKSNK